jgi:hypothetical protein
MMTSKPFGAPMNKPLKIIVSLFAALFVFMGLRWVVNPEAAALAQFMPLLDGMALSSQIADIGAVFLSMGVMILLGVVSENKTWFQATILMLMTIAVMRIMAWLFHDAALAIPMILVELLVSTALYFCCKQIAKKEI